MTETVEEMIRSVDEVLGDTSQSKKVVRQLLNDFGGLQVYLPLPSTAFRDEDHKAIYDEFDGTNQKELCRKYGISFTAFYRICSKEKKRRAAESSKSLEKELPFDK